MHRIEESLLARLGPVPSKKDVDIAISRPMSEVSGNTDSCTTNRTLDCFAHRQLGQGNETLLPSQMSPSEGVAGVKQSDSEVSYHSAAKLLTTSVIGELDLAQPLPAISCSDRGPNESGSLCCETATIMASHPLFQSWPPRHITPKKSHEVLHPQTRPPSPSGARERPSILDRTLTRPDLVKETSLATERRSEYRTTSNQTYQYFSTRV